ncbi:MAG: hypothetical protein NT080_13710 [Spirochaetes bacterium]|nr:hypothetical protein [Spirochaetota bacterium]
MNSADSKALLELALDEDPGDIGEVMTRVICDSESVSADLVAKQESIGGKPDPAREAVHSVRRIRHVCDTTDRAIGTSLLDYIRTFPIIKVDPGERFPKIHETCPDAGMELRKEPIPAITSGDKP